MVRFSKYSSARFSIATRSRFLCFLLVTFLTGLSAESVLADETNDFPYTLVVASQTADVLSGPGKSHYATDRLAKGSKVLIYRHDPGGYYAVRPPEGSFSLVLASAIKPTADPKVIEVQTKSAKAWVGSRLSGNFKPMWQLKLKQGELLNVVRKVSIRGSQSNDSEWWYQVEPPRGEFRWIHKDQLEALAPASISSAEIANRQISDSRSQVELANRMGAARRQMEITSTNRGGWKVLETDPRRQTNVSVNEAFYQASFPKVGDSVDQQISSIDLALSQMVLGPKASWRLNSLQSAVDKLRRVAATGHQLDEANRLAQKIVDFQKIKSQSENVTSMASRASGPSSSVGANSPPNLSGVRYDGRGILRKLYSNGGVGPAIYALEDDQGKVVKTISPSSGVNLERFVGKPVGLFGKSGFNQKLNRPHLTAQRVVDLKKIR